MKGCHRTQQTNGRRRRTTERANDAVISLNWLADFQESSLAPCVHVEFMDKKHSALWRHLCGEALRRQSTAPSERQGTDVALSALLQRMTDYSVSSYPGNLASHKKRLYRSRRECATAHTSTRWWSAGRWYLEEEQQRMRRDPEEIEVATLPQVYNDPVLKRNQKLYDSIVRDMKSRGMLSATVSSLKHVGFFLSASPAEGYA